MSWLQVMMFFFFIILKVITAKESCGLNHLNRTALTPASGNLSSFLRQRARWISKAGAYNDGFTRVLAIVTFVTISVQLLLFVGGLFKPMLLWIFAVYFALKSIPDFLVLSNTAARYGKKNLLRWFLPSQLAYPFYVIAIIPCSFVNRDKW